MMLNPAAGLEPKLTAFAPVNPEPAIVTCVPPEDGPLVGETDVTLGGGGGGGVVT